MTRSVARAVAAAVLVVLLAAAAVPAPAAGSVGGEAPVAYRAPVTGGLVVVRGFDEVGRYEAGHRGVDLAVLPPATVLAAAAGTVTFAGPVAGRGVVVVAHADGIRTTYEPVAPAVSAGTVVAAGGALGVVSGSHDGFAPGTVLHWGARRGEEYLDPLSLLAPLGPVRLLPWDDP